MPKQKERYIACHRNAKPGTCAHMKVQLYKKSFLLCRRLNGTNSRLERMNLYEIT